jgi:hypothetical protein
VGGGHGASSCVVFLDLDMHAQTNMCYTTEAVRSLRWICKQILLEIVMAGREIVCFEFLCRSDSSRTGICMFHYFLES